MEITNCEEHILIYAGYMKPVFACMGDRMVACDGQSMYQGRYLKYALQTCSLVQIGIATSSLMN